MELLPQSVSEVLDVITKRKSPQEAAKTVMSKTVKKQIGGRSEQPRRTKKHKATTKPKRNKSNWSDFFLKSKIFVQRFTSGSITQLNGHFSTITRFDYFWVFFWRKHWSNFVQSVGRGSNFKWLAIETTFWTCHKFFCRSNAKRKKKTIAQIYDMTPLMPPNLITLSLLSTLSTRFYCEPRVTANVMENSNSNVVFAHKTFSKRNILLEKRKKIPAKLARIYSRSRLETMPVLFLQAENRK